MTNLNNATERTYHLAKAEKYAQNLAYHTYQVEGYETLDESPYNEKIDSLLDQIYDMEGFEENRAERVAAMERAQEEVKAEIKRLFDEREDEIENTPMEEYMNIDVNANFNAKLKKLYDAEIEWLK